jgi:hypothetical protein
MHGRQRVPADIGSEVADAWDLLCLPREANGRGDHSDTRKEQAGKNFTPPHSITSPIGHDAIIPG